MVNIAPATYTVQIGPVVTPEMAGELAAWAEHRRVSLGQSARECIDTGLAQQRLAWQLAHGQLPPGLLEKHVTEMRARGDKQVRSRRDYDRRTRGGETAMSETIAERRAARGGEQDGVEASAAEDAA